MKQGIVCLMLTVTFCGVIKAQFDYSDEFEPYDYDSGESVPFEEYDTTGLGFKEAYIEQCMDHLYKTDPSEACTPTWKHRYWYSKKFYARGGSRYRSSGGGEFSSEFPMRRRRGQRLRYGLYGMASNDNPMRRTPLGNRRLSLYETIHSTQIRNRLARSSIARESFLRHTTPLYTVELGHCRRSCRRPRWNWRRPLESDGRFCVRSCIMSICESEWRSLRRRQSIWGEWSSR